MIFKSRRGPRNSKIMPDGTIVHYGGDALYIGEQEMEAYTRTYDSNGGPLDGTEWVMIEDENMRESGLEQHFQKSVRAAGGWAIKLMPTQTGVPDRMVLFNGSIYLVELKTDTGSLSKIQVWWHKKVETFGVHVHVLYGKADVDRWIEEELR